MDPNARPRLRPLRGREAVRDGRPVVALECPLGVFAGQVCVDRDWWLAVVRHFDGTQSADDLRGRFLRETGRELAAETLASIVARLDRELVLDGESFAAYLATYRAETLRPAVHAGRSYAGDALGLREQLAGYFAGPDASPAKAQAPPATLRGVLTPHIDFGRGGPVYSWAYREVLERSDADIFVIFGVAHSPCRRRFALTRKDFATPLGTVRTDQQFVDLLAAAGGEVFFEDELAHRPEHSVEFQAVFLRYILGERRPFTIVPILAGSFHDLLRRHVDPIDDPEVAQMTSAVRHAEANVGKTVAYIGGIDLCHVGREFGDPDLLTPGTLDQVRRFDAAMLDRAAAGDAAGWFGVAAEVEDRWRVCGLSATYSMIHAMGPARGRILQYDQAVNPGLTCCVSFASLAYDAVPISSES